MEPNKECFRGRSGRDTAEENVILAVRRRPDKTEKKSHTGCQELPARSMGVLERLRKSPKRFERTFGNWRCPGDESVRTRAICGSRRSGSVSQDKSVENHPDGTYPGSASPRSRYRQKAPMAFQTFRTGQAHATWCKQSLPARAPMKRNMNMAQRYQDGHLRRAKRKRRVDVWEFLWRERGLDAKRHPRPLTVGKVDELLTEREALNRIQLLRTNINRDYPRSALMTFQDLATHYRQT